MGVVCLALAVTACGKKSGNAPADSASADTTAAAPTTTPAPSAAPTATPKTKATGADPGPAAPTGLPVSQDTYTWETHKATNMKFELPSSWKTSIKGDVLLASTAGAEVQFIGAASTAAIKSDEKTMLKEVGKTLKSVKVTQKSKPVEQHGAKGFQILGKGSRDGKEVDWTLSGLGGKQKAILALGLYFAEATPAVKEQLVRILNSIQPAS